MFDEQEERPDSSRIKRIKEMLAEIMQMVDAPEEPAAPEGESLELPKEEPKF